MNYGRDISRGIISRQKSGRVEIEIGMAISTYPDTSGKIEMAIPIDLAHCEPDCVLLLYSSREVQPSVVVLSVTRLGDLSPFGRYFEHSGDNIRNWQLKVNPIYKSKAY